MARRPPPLYRLSRILRLVGLAVLTVLIIYVGLVIYSASMVKPSTKGGASAAHLESNGTAQITQSVNLSNPGFFGFSDLTTAVVLTWPNGTFVGSGGSAPLSVPGGGEGRINVSFWLPLATSASQLLTHSASLTLKLWLNLTYASLLTLHVSNQQNYSWGAPFANFNATPGSPTPQSNGTLLVPVTVSYNNEADFGVGGTASVRVLSSTGAACTSSSLNVGTSAHGSFYQTVDLYLAASCNPSGGSIVVTFTGSGITYTFPPQGIP